MKKKLLMILSFIASMSCMYIYSSGMQDEHLHHENDNHRDTTSMFITRKVEQLERLGLPRLQGQYLAMSVTRSAHNETRFKAFVGRYDTERDLFFIDPIYDTHDDARKILQSISEYVATTNDHLAIHYPMQNLDVGQTRIIYWQL